MKRISLTILVMAISMVAISRDFTTHVTLTSYNPTTGQCDDSPLVTADNSTINLKKLKKGEIKWCAVSRDLLGDWAIPMGSLIHIEGYGYYEVRDTMNSRFNHCIDILQHSSKPNFKLTNVKIKVIRKGKVK